jgi:hypothetical protein
MIDRELRAGLPREQERLGNAIRVLDYYELRGVKYVPKRDAESGSDYRNRIKRTLPFARRVVDVLCSQLYNPGPTRSLQNDDAANEWLQGVYRDNLVNAILQRADRLATLQGIAAVQVAATGDDRRPIQYQLWGEEQLTLYPDENDATTIKHVVTIDRQDQQTRYTWWSAESFKVYVTKRLTIGQTSGGRVAELVKDEDNPYGILPFAFIHHEIPTNGYCVSGLGDYLADINAGLDIEASDMAEAVSKYHRPWGFVYDAASDWQPIVKMGNLIRLNTNPTDLDRSNPPRVEFAQPDLDIQGGWDNIRSAIDTALEGIGVPQSLYRLNQATLPSGAALMAEQQPLVDYSRSRQVSFERYETDLARATLTIGGLWYDRPELDAAAADIKLSVTWPPVTIRTPGQEQDIQDQTSIAMGIESTAMITKRRLALNSDEEVWEHLEQVAEDEQRLAMIKQTPESEDTTDAMQAQGTEAPEAGQVSEDDADEQDDSEESSAETVD